MDLSIKDKNDDKYMGITASSPIRTKNVSQEKDVIVNASPLEPLSKFHSKAIYTPSTILAKDVSLDKGPDRVSTSAWIMTRRTIKQKQFS